MHTLGGGVCDLWCMLGSQPPYEQTDRCKNFTLPQTKFVGCKNWCVPCTTDNLLKQRTDVCVRYVDALLLPKTSNDSSHKEPVCLSNSTGRIFSYCGWAQWRVRALNTLRNFWPRLNEEWHDSLNESASIRKLGHCSTFVLPHISGACSIYCIFWQFTPKGVLDSVNYGCFVWSRCKHFHCNSMRTSVKSPMNWKKI